MFDPMFVPPRHNPMLYWFARTFVPQLGRYFGNVHSVRIQPQDLDALQSLTDGRALVCSNHPTETDPIVMFWLSRLVQRRFHFLATREQLEGLRGRLMNQIGVYSVIRGFPDRESIRTTRRLLAEEDRPIVIFPEGLVYQHNDRLMDFQSGVAQMGFWALDDLEKSGKPGGLPVVPVAIKYRCVGDPRPAIERALRVLESALHLEPSPAEADYLRLIRIGSRVLATMERQEGIAADEDKPIGERMEEVRQRTLRRVARAIGAELDERNTRADQLHQMTNALRTWVGVLPEDASEYDERLHRQRSAVAAPLYGELFRLHNFVAMTGDYVASQPTAERLLEVLGRLEVEVLGNCGKSMPMIATVKVGAPILLEERYAEYKKNKREVVADVTRHLHGAIGAMLAELSDSSTPR